VNNATLGHHASLDNDTTLGIVASLGNDVTLVDDALGDNATHGGIAAERCNNMLGDDI
jgi:hypothetical protein